MLSWARVKAFLIAQHMPIGLAVMVLFGFLVPEPGIFLSQTPINTISICGIFFLSGLNLMTSEVRKAARAYVAILFGFLSILLLTPLLSLALAPMPLSPPEFPLGLALFMSMPSTVSTGVLMTGEAKGNVALAVLFSVGTNLVGVLTVPFWLKAYATDDVAAASSALNPLDLLWKLALTILLPLLVGKSLRYFTRVCDFVKKHKMKLKLLSSALLISVPWITMSVSSAKLRAASGTAILILIGLALALHTLLLVFNYISCMLLRMPQSQKKAVVINASQKTVNTAVSVISFLPPAIGDPGLIMLPCIISHFVQTIVDAYVVAQWKKYVDDEDAGAPAKAAAPPAPALPSDASQRLDPVLLRDVAGAGAGVPALSPKYGATDFASGTGANGDSNGHGVLANGLHLGEAAEPATSSDSDRTDADAGFGDAAAFAARLERESAAAASTAQQQPAPAGTPASRLAAWWKAKAPSRMSLLV